MRSILEVVLVSYLLLFKLITCQLDLMVEPFHAWIGRIMNDEAYRHGQTQAMNLHFTCYDQTKS